MSIVLFDIYQLYFLFIVQLVYLYYFRPFNNLKDNIIEISNSLLCFIQVVLLLFLTIRENYTIKFILLVVQIFTIVMNCLLGLIESSMFCFKCIKRNICKKEIL